MEFIYKDKNIHGRNATKLIRALSENELGQTYKRLSEKSVKLYEPKKIQDKDLFWDIIEFAIGNKLN